MYRQILDSFKDDEQFLKSTPDFSEKEEELEKKFKKEEQKKIDKLMKRDLNEWDDQYGGNPALSTSAKGLQTLGDRLIKIMNDSVRKSLKKCSLAEEARQSSMQQRDEIEGNLNKSLKVRNSLEVLCNSILDKNYQLYLKHERMLDDERVKRSELAADFQKRMAEVTNEINELKEERQTEFKANQDIRAKI